MAAGPTKPAYQDALKVGKCDVVKDSEPIDGDLEKSENNDVMKNGNAEEEQDDPNFSDPNMDYGNVSTPTASTDAIPPSGSNPAVAYGPKYFTASEEAQAEYDQAADLSVKTVVFV